MLALAAHVLLLAGAPNLAAPKIRAGDPDAAFVTRLVAPPAPEPATTPPAPAAAFEPQAPPRPTPRPRRATPPVKPGTPPPETRGGAGDDPDASLLAPPPLASFGGGRRGPAPILPPLDASAAAAALQFARGAGDAPVRIAPGAEIRYRTVGQFGAQAIDFRTTLNWRQDGQFYEANWVLYSPLIGEHTRTSAGLLSPQGLTPVEATLRTPEVQAMRFDYAARQVHFGAPDAGPPSAGDAPLRPGAQDRLSVLLQLGALLAGDAGRYPVGSRIELPAVRPHGAGAWRFTVEAEEQISALQGRELPTLLLTHQPEDGSDARIEVWLGRTINYLPVRLRITEPNGDTVEHTMQTAYLQRTPPAAALPAPVSTNETTRRP